MKFDKTYLKITLLPAIFTLFLISVLCALVVSAVRGGLGFNHPDEVSAGPLRFAEFETIIPLPNNHISINNPLGEILVTGGGKPGEISIRAIVQLGPNEQNKHDDFWNSLLAINKRSNETDITAIPFHRVPFLRRVWGRHRPMNLLVRVPDDVSITVKSSFSRVQLSRFRGEFFVFSESGDVEIQEFAGSLAVETDGRIVRVNEASIGEQLIIKTDEGSIHFSGVPGKQSLLQSKSGSITLEIPGTGSYEIHADAGAGIFESQVPIVNGRVGQGAPRGDIRLVTQSGSILVKGIQK